MTIAEWSLSYLAFAVTREGVWWQKRVFYLHTDATLDSGERGVKTSKRYTTRLWRWPWRTLNRAMAREAEAVMMAMKKAAETGTDRRSR
jgi:hypothetical protein